MWVGLRHSIQVKSSERSEAVESLEAGWPLLSRLYQISFSRISQRSYFQNPTSSSISETYWLMGPEEILSKQKLPARVMLAQLLSEGQALAHRPRDTAAAGTLTQSARRCVQVCIPARTRFHKSREDLCLWETDPSLGNATLPAWGGRKWEELAGAGWDSKPVFPCLFLYCQHIATCAKQKAISGRSLGF